MKKLYKSQTDRYICGVCGGLGEYFGVDSTVFRLLLAALTVMGGSGILLYIVMAIIMPKDPDIIG